MVADHARGVAAYAKSVDFLERLPIARWCYRYSYSHINFTACYYMHYFIGGNCLPHICAVNGMICCSYIIIATERLLSCDTEDISLERCMYVLSTGDLH